MNHVPIKSRIIKSVYFSPDDGQLRIIFKNGEERRFAGIDEAVVDAMVEAPSPGQYYIDHIRPRFRRLAG